MSATLVALGLGVLVPLVLVRAFDAYTPSLDALKFVSAGAAVAIPATIVELKSTDVIQPLGLTFEQNQFLYAFAVSALLEEILRFVAIDSISRAKLCSDVSSFLWAAVWLSVGFAAVENSYYVLTSESEDAVGIATGRLMLPTLIHACCGVMLASGHHRLGGYGSATAVGLVILFHGVYNWIALARLTSHYPLLLWALVGLIVCGELAFRARIADALRSSLRHSKPLKSDVTVRRR